MAKVCKGLLNGKAPGLDIIPYNGLTYGNGSLYLVLTRLYNAIIYIINSTYITSAHIYKQSVAIPLHKWKRKPKNEPGSYRGVALTLSINKVLERRDLWRLETDTPASESC